MMFYSRRMKRFILVLLNITYRLDAFKQFQLFQSGRPRSNNHQFIVLVENLDNVDIKCQTDIIHLIIMKKTKIYYWMVGDRMKSNLMENKLIFTFICFYLYRRRTKSDKQWLYMFCYCFVNPYSTTNS
jgi:hypothetical protein